ncbi:XdhC family protein [Patulibacter sp. S7RM1-6]
MDALIPHLRRARADGERVALATVVGTRRSAPRPLGAKLLVLESGAIVGSVSGGCVEADVCRVAEGVLATGIPSLRTYGYTDDDAFAVGLPCGGEIDVFVERLEPGAAAPTGVDPERLLAPGSAGERTAVMTVLDGARAGTRALASLETGATEGDRDLPALDALVAAAGTLARPAVLEHHGVRVFVDLPGPAIRLVVVGAYDLAEELCAGGRRLGWSTVVVDARERLATAERVPSADEIVVAWPDEGLARARVDPASAVVVITHDAKFDVPALRAAVRGPAFYVGALGSRQHQAGRRRRLGDAGLDASEIDRIAAPCGLDLGGETPAETALSILAEIVARRNDRAGAALATGAGPIHVRDGGAGVDAPVRRGSRKA